MAAAPAFTWKIAPDAQLIPNLGDYGERVIQGLHLLADYFCAQMEAHMKATAPWTDRTGAARAGLTSFAVKAATGVILYLIGQASYIPYLELGTKFMAPRPVIVPTMEAFHAPIMAAVRKLVGA